MRIFTDFEQDESASQFTCHE